LRKFGTQEDFLKKILQFFNELHWIRIENIKDLSFRIDQVFEKNPEQEQMLIKYLSQQAEISQNNGIFYLN